ncbi:GTP cyclohydrolase [Platysternon megacephalum]|uniref:GTP cyclohydrolase n=1 Tax=Platysternon megacephalum TaxID=55544 RepID=A0A4D9DDX2_9SAUR|nr:GTP cyclohydrolase [Platysternon megacephalum]
MDQVVAEARWLAEHGVKEVLLVSENSTSYGKDLGNIRLLDELLVRLADVDGLDLIRVSYLQPAEIRPDLLAVMNRTPKVAPYFDLSFQHASGTVLRRMRRFGGSVAFLDLIATIRAADPTAGIRSNVIVGFPGETEADIAELQSFISAAELDAVGVFRYSDEEGTEAEGYAEKLPEDVIEARYQATQRIAEAAMASRSARRVGHTVRVLVEQGGVLPEGEDADDDAPWGRAEHQGPEVDGTCMLITAGPGSSAREVTMGQWVRGVVVDSNGPDLVVEVK